MMKKAQSNVDLTEDLRARMEKFLTAAGPDMGQMPLDDIQQLVRELQGYQNTLEMQNEELHGAQETIAKTQNRYAALYDFAPVAYFTLDLQGYITEVNLAGTRLLGEPRDSLLKTAFIRFVAPEGHEEFRAHLQPAPGGGVSRSSELLLQPTQAPPFPAVLESLAVLDSGNTVVQYYTVVRDISRRRQAETDLRKSEALYRLIVETANEGVWAMDAGYRTTFVNPVMPKMLGYRMEEMIGRPVTDFMFPEELDNHEGQMSQRRQGRDGTYERRFRRKDGSELWCIVSAKSLMDDQAQFQGSFAMFTDITQRKQAEESLRLAAHQWQATFDAISDGICLLDLNCRILGCNQAMATLVGQPLDEILGCHCYEIVHDSSEPIPECPLAPMLESRQREEVVLSHKERWLKVTVDPILDETGSPIGAVHRIADITLLIKSEEALKENEAHFRQLFESSADAIFLHDQGKIVEVNKQACQSLGYSREELLRLKVMDIEAELDWQEIQRLRGADSSKDIFIGKHRRKDGSTFPVEVSASNFPDKGRNLRLAAVRDITAQRQTEQAIRESEKLYRSLFENMLNGFSYCKMLFENNQPQDFIYLEVNSAFEVLTGLKHVVGKKVSEVIPGVHEANPEILEIYGRVALTGKPEKFEIYLEALKMWFSISVYSPEKEYFVATFDVITDRKQAEEALRQSRETLRVLLDATPAGVCLLDPQGVILASNKMVAERFGKPIQEIVGTCIFDYLESDLAQMCQDHLEEIKRCHQPLNFEDRCAGLTFDIYVHPILSATGELAGLAVLSVDITARKQAEEALAQQSQFLQLLIDTISTPVFYKDAEGRYLGCNRAFREFYGLSQEQIVGKTVDCLGSQELAEKGRQMDLELFRNPGIQLFEYGTRRVDGSLRQLVINKATFPQADGTVGGLIGVFTDVTEIKETQKQLRALAARLAEVEEKERHILARELHDEVGQGLTALGLNLTLLTTQMPKKAAQPLLTRLADAVALVEKIGEAIRNVMAELRPPVLDDYGLLSALRWYGKEFSQQTSIGVEIQGEEAVPRLARSVEMALFRIAQEALTNVAKHAAASHVELIEEVDNGTVRLIIADNGVGFDQARIGQPQGRYRWGLMNMSERAAAAGGSCHIESRPDHGTRVVVEVSR